MAIATELLCFILNTPELGIKQGCYIKVLYRKRIYADR